MTHKLSQRHPHSAIGHNPLIVSMRYRCQCGQNEILQLSMAVDLDVTRERFLATMGAMFDDLHFEVDQHINPPLPPATPRVENA